MLRTTRHYSGEHSASLCSYLWLQLGEQNNDEYLLTALHAKGYHAESHSRLPKKKPQNKEEVVILSKEESFRLLDSGVLHALSNVYRLCAVIPPRSPVLMEKTVEAEVMTLFSINQPFRQMAQNLSVARLYKTYVDPLLQLDLVQVVRLNQSAEEDLEPSVKANKIDGALDLNYAKASVTLTASECRVLDSILKGKSNRKIAEDDYLSVSTVNNHVSQLTKKMNANDRTHTVKRVVEFGWLRGG